jgi:Zn finger protein HypA/HybF involved in hydrogenase expression
MEFKMRREENPVDALIELLKSGNYRKAKIKLGQLRGRPEDFRNMFEYLTKDTKLEGTRLKIQPVRAKVECNFCDWIGDPEIQPNDIKCPRCRRAVKVLRGDELQIHV